MLREVMIGLKPFSSSNRWVIVDSGSQMSNVIPDIDYERLVEALKEQKNCELVGGIVYCKCKSVADWGFPTISIRLGGDTLSVNGFGANPKCS